MDPIVKLDGISKQFGGRPAIEHVSFQVQPQEFVSIVGPSGCGKSTLLRIVAGLIGQSGGQVSVRGKDVRGPIADVGMVFQAAVLLPWRTTLANILFMAEMRGERPGKYAARAKELIALAGLQGFERSYPHELSGGMQQRAAICRALLLNPSIILMDEPFGALDIITREKMAFELQRIWSASQNTVLFVTHSITEAVLLSETVIVMSARPGRIRDIVEIDLPRPRETASLRDAKFIALSAALREKIESQAVE